MSDEELKTIPLESLPPVKLEAAGDSPDLKEANLQRVMPSPGYPHAILLLADAISKRADLVVMDFSQQQCAVRYQVDGMWYSMPSLSRMIGDYMLASMKQLAGLDYRQRRARQSGGFTATYLRKKHKCQLTSQGVPTGERVVLAIDRQRPPTGNLEEIGMRPGMRTRLIEIMNQSGGLVLFSALPGDGLSTTWRAALQSTDRFMRDFVVMEEKSRSEPEIINVESVTYDSSQGETLEQVLRSVLLREPHVVAFTELPDGKTLDRLTYLSNSRDLTTFGRLHAKHAVEAVLRALQLKPDVPGLARALRAVVGQRIVRMLCKSCRQPYQPSPKLLEQLGLPASRVPVLYRPFQPSREDLVDSNGRPVELQPCETCGGPGYYERTGIFELLVVDDRFRQAMQEPNPTVASLAAAAAKSGHMTLRDEGIVMVARGDLSIDELQRVLKK
jgi:type II secretory ATPase GspE/PulE/Tfp pilus assembly ATPase PilB-like protein